MYSRIVVTNRHLCIGDFKEQIASLVKNGADYLILREKDLEEAAYEELAAQILEICKGTKTSCILHTYVDAALRLGAEAIHLPLSAAEMQWEKLRQFQRVGISTHSLEQVRQAEALGADYVTYGHVYATDCKKGAAPRGLEALREVCSGTSLPVYAIGGITPQRLAAVMDAGAAGICVMSSAMRDAEIFCKFK